MSFSSRWRAAAALVPYARLLGGFVLPRAGFADCGGPALFFADQATGDGYPLLHQCQVCFAALAQFLLDFCQPVRYLRVTSGASPGCRICSGAGVRGWFLRRFGRLWRTGSSCLIFGCLWGRYLMEFGGFYFECELCSLWRFSAFSTRSMPLSAFEVLTSRLIFASNCATLML